MMMMMVVVVVFVLAMTMMISMWGRPAPNWSPGWRSYEAWLAANLTQLMMVVVMVVMK